MPQTWPLVLGLLAVIVLYRMTLAPSVLQIDTGELATVQALAGIAHPTGYPLFTMIGYLALQIPWASSKILQCNTLSLIWCVVGVILFMAAVRMLLIQLKVESHPKSRDKKPKTQKSKVELSKPVNPTHITLAVLVSGLLLAFNRTYWMQATSVEVYALQVVLFTATLLFLVRANFSGFDSIRPWLWVSVCLALGFSNHMTMLLIIPGTAYLFFSKQGFQKRTFVRVLYLGAAFLLVIVAMYVYLPLRASGDPVLNWGNPRNWENFIRHVSGKQYQVWLFSSSQAAFQNLDRFFRQLPHVFTWPGLILFFIGFFAGWMRSKQISIYLTVTAVFSIGYAVNYDIHDLESYFLLTYLIMAVWIALGVLWLLQRFKKRNTQIVLFCLLGLITVYSAVSHYSEADQSDVHIYEDYTKQALGSLSEDALLLSYQWDVLISPAYYFQFAESIRPDVAVVDKELLRRSWYFRQMAINYPDVMNGIKPEEETFLKALAPFEKGDSYNANVIEQAYRRLIARMIETNLGERDVFLAPELVQNELARRQLYLPERTALVPHLFFFKVVRGKDYVPLQNTDVSIRFPKIRNRYTDMVRNMVSTMLSWRVQYEVQSNKMEEARCLKLTFQTQFPGVPLPKPMQDL